MNITRLADTMVFVNAIVACSAYAAAERSPAIFLVFAAVGGLGWWLTQIRGARPVSRLVGGFMVFGAVAWSAYRVLSGDALAGLTVSVFCEFLLMILAIKLWDRRMSRDLAQMLTLSVFLGVGAILTSNSVAVGAMLVINIATLVAAVTVFHISAALERASPAVAAVGLTAPATPVRLWQLGVLHAAVVLVGLGVSVGVWFMMPRGIGMNRLGHFGEITGGRRTGFTSRVDLRRSGLISESSRQVMEVDFRTEDATRLGGDGQVFYMRGAVLDHYRNGAWTEDWTEPETDGEKSADRRNLTSDRVPVPGMPKSSIIVQQVHIREASGRRMPLMALFEPMSIRADADSTLAINAKTKTIAREGRAGRFSYTVWSGTPVVESPEQPYEHEPVDDPATERVRRLAVRLVRDAGFPTAAGERTPQDDLGACRAIERYLRENCVYTLETPALPIGADPVENFVFETKAGHCEFFASAMATMCRAVGINARVIAGYVVGEFDPATQRYIVRESNAHAWVEAKISRNTWRTFDPTPPDTIRRQVAAPSGAMAAINGWLDALDDVWSNSVVSFDESSRSSVLTRWTPESAARGLGLFESSNPLKRLIPTEGWRSLAASALIILSVVALWFGLRAAAVEFGEMAAKWWATVRAQRAQPAVVGVQGRFYTRMLAGLRRSRRAKPSGVPPLRHAELIAATDPELAEHVRAASRLFYKLRFGRTELSDAEARAAEEHVAAVESAPRAPGSGVR